MGIKQLLGVCLFFYATNILALPNPASVNCGKKGGRLILYKGSTGICVFRDGSYCEEWAYFKNICRPGLNKLAKNMSFQKLDQYCLMKQGKQSIFVFCPNP